MSEALKSGATVRAAAGAGALGLALVGAGEAIHLWISGGLSAGDGVATAAWALGIHGLIGLVAGLVAGGVLLVAARLRPSLPLTEARVAAWTAGLGWAAGAFIIGLFRLKRDAGLGTVAAALGALALAAGLGLVFGRLAGRLMQSTAVALGTVAACVVAFLVGGALLTEAPALAGDGEGAGTAEKPNVILVVIDTFRADMIGVYGGADEEGQSLTPNLDAFAGEAVRFERMNSNATWTRPAVTSILTGQLPGTHGVRHKVDAVSPESPLIAKGFQAAGYKTAATVTNVNLAPDFGFETGFDAYRYHGPVRPLGATGAAVRLSLVNIARLVQEKLSKKLVPNRFYAEAPDINRDAGELLDGLKDGPFFLWVHYMDPHDPFLRRPYDGHGIARVRTPEPEPEMAEEMRALYQGEVKYWDEAFGGFMADLKTRGLLDNTVVAVTADHGEEFYEHQGFWHGTSLHAELTHVPLLIRLPGAARGGTVDRRPVSQIDVAPTLLSTAGVDVPEAMQGTDVLVATDDGNGRLIVMEEDHDGMVMTGLVQGSLKLVRAEPGNPRGLPERMLFDVVADPFEKNDLAQSRAEDVKTMEARLEEGLKGMTRAETGTVTVDAALEEDLRALGYVQ